MVQGSGAGGTGRKKRPTVPCLLLALLLAAALAAPAAGQAWWNSSWRYRINATADPVPWDRADFPVEVRVDFNSLLASMGVTQGFNESSVRVVEHNATGGVLWEVPSQVDLYDPPPNGSAKDARPGPTEVSCTVSGSPVPGSEYCSGWTIDGDTLTGDADCNDGVAPTCGGASDNEYIHNITLNRTVARPGDVVNYTILYNVTPTADSSDLAQTYLFVAYWNTTAWRQVFCGKPATAGGQNTYANETQLDEVLGTHALRAGVLFGRLQVGVNDPTVCEAAAVNLSDADWVWNTGEINDVAINVSASETPEVVWIANGSTSANALRYFYIYFDTTDPGISDPANKTNRTDLSWSRSGDNYTFNNSFYNVSTNESRGGLLDTLRYLYGSGENLNATNLSAHPGPELVNATGVWSPSNFTSPAIQDLLGGPSAPAPGSTPVRIKYRVGGNLSNTTRNAWNTYTVNYTFYSNVSWFLVETRMDIREATAGVTEIRNSRWLWKNGNFTNITSLNATEGPVDVGFGTKSLNITANLTLAVGLNNSTSREGVFWANVSWNRTKSTDNATFSIVNAGLEAWSRSVALYGSADLASGDLWKETHRLGVFNGSLPAFLLLNNSDRARLLSPGSAENHTPRIANASVLDAADNQSKTTFTRGQGASLRVSVNLTDPADDLLGANATIYNADAPGTLFPDTPANRSLNLTDPGPTYVSDPIPVKETSASDGDWVVLITANDSAGNSNQTRITFRVNPPSPNNNGGGGSGGGGGGSREVIERLRLVGNSSNFILENLAVSPWIATVGDEIRVTVLAKNVGDLGGSTTVTVKVDGQVADIQTVQLEAGGSSLLTFRVGRDIAPGNHTVEVGDLRGGFTLLARPTFAPKFVVAAVDVVDREVEAGQPLRVRLTVRNEGNAPGSFSPNLTVGGQLVTAPAVLLAPGESREVFVDLFARSGEHRLAVEGAPAGGVKVVELLPPPHPAFVVLFAAVQGAGLYWLLFRRLLP